MATTSVGTVGSQIIPFSPFEMLVDDNLFHIFSRAEKPKDIQSLTQTCRRFDTYISESKPLWTALLKRHFKGFCTAEDYPKEQYKDALSFVNTLEKEKKRAFTDRDGFPIFQPPGHPLFTEMRAAFLNNEPHALAFVESLKQKENYQIRPLIGRLSDPQHSSTLIEHSLGHNEWSSALHLLERDGKLISVADDNTFLIYDIETEELLKYFQLNLPKGERGNFVQRLEVYRDKIFTVPAPHDDVGCKNIHVWNFDGKHLSVLKGHQGEVNSLCANEQMLFSCDDHTINAWHTDSEKLLWTVKLGDKKISCIYAHENKLFVGYENAHIDVLNIKDGKVVGSTRHDKSSEIYSLRVLNNWPAQSGISSFHVHGNKLYSGDQVGFVQAQDIESLKTLWIAYDPVPRTPDYLCSYGGKLFAATNGPEADAMDEEDDKVSSLAVLDAEGEKILAVDLHTPVDRKLIGYIRAMVMHRGRLFIAHHNHPRHQNHRITIVDFIPNSSYRAKKQEDAFMETESAKRVKELEAQLKALELRPKSENPTAKE